jgi:predicted secreted hydrolase
MTCIEFFQRLIFVGTVILLAAISASAQEGFRQVTGPCRLSFPADHGTHPEYRTEWWYYTGNLTTGGDRHFGFQLTFFRRALQPALQRKKWPDPASAWRSDQIYLAHAAISDIAADRHLQAQRMARPVLSMAGVEQAGASTTVHVQTWQAVITSTGHTLRADAGEFAIELEMEAVKKAVLHGNDGYSRKGQEPERASCYYSFTRLQASGNLTVEGTHHEVQGLAWMDHEFSTAPLQPGISGWDWFSLQLSDHSEVMIFLLRQADGSLNPATSGTFVTESGETRHLHQNEIQITPLAHWKSPRSGARYPVKWRLRIPLLQLDLSLAASLNDQEMDTQRSTGVVYWEGSVRTTGNRGEVPIEGVGYVEMTGYASPFKAPL